MGFLLHAYPAAGCLWYLHVRCGRQPSTMPAALAPSHLSHNSVQELSDWRGRISQQVEAHRGDLLDLQASLTEEMAGLRRELAGVKATIRSQLEASEAALGTLRSSGSAHPPTGAGS